MSKKISAKKAALLGVCAACAYKFIKGEGIFNKPRYYAQYKAVEGYLATYHPGATFTNIVKNDSGWHCIVNATDKSFVLNIHKTDDGMYLFGETDL